MHAKDVRQEPLPLDIDIDAAAFRRGLVALLETGVPDLHTAVRSLVTEGIAASLDPHVQSGRCLSYTFKDATRSDTLSVKSAIANGGFGLWYLTIRIDMLTGTTIEETSIMQPTVMKWLPLRYSGIEKRFKLKHKQMKTRERYDVTILHPVIPASLFAHIPGTLSPDECCVAERLSPTPLGVYQWWQPFHCLVCGNTYFCDCFQDAIEKHTVSVNTLPHNQKGDLAHRFLKTTANPQYRLILAIFCTGASSTLFYCAPMYGSEIMVRYGAYIKKTAVEKDIPDRDAENEIRERIGIPRIGEGWVSETQLYKCIETVLAGHEIIREASPNWLGSQRLDIYIPSLSIAIEYQGEQHFMPVARFGGDEGLRKTRDRDRRKKRLCKENNVRIIYFRYNEDLSIEHIKSRLDRAIQ